MNTSTEILSYLKKNSGFFRHILDSEHWFSNRIKKHDKYLSIIASALLDDKKYYKFRSIWLETAKHLLEHLYLPQFEWYNNLEKLYNSRGGEILRCIGENSDFVEEKQDECHVCCSEFSENDTPISCGHWVCRDCIVNSGKECCPICRKKVSLTIEEYKTLLKVKDRLKKEKYEEERRQLLHNSQFNDSNNHEIINIEAFVNPATIEQITRSYLIYNNAVEQERFVPYNR